MNILETEPIGRIRRNHGIEHATVHVLAEWDSQIQLVGRADSKGFNIYGDVDDDTLAAATVEALDRMKNGEGNLAVHPRCGTQLVVAGLLTAAAAFIALGRRPRLSRLPDAIVATTLAALVAQPLGLTVQRTITTSPDVFNARYSGITPKKLGNIDYKHVDIYWSEPQLT